MLAIILEAGINIYHRSMLDIVADVGLQTMVIAEWVTGMTEEMVENGTTITSKYLRK